MDCSTLKFVAQFVVLGLFGYLAYCLHKGVIYFNPDDSGKTEFWRHEDPKNFWFGIIVLGGLAIFLQVLLLMMNK